MRHLPARDRGGPRRARAVLRRAAIPPCAASSRPTSSSTSSSGPAPVTRRRVARLPGLPLRRCPTTSCGAGSTAARRDALPGLRGAHDRARAADDGGDAAGCRGDGDAPQRQRPTRPATSPRPASRARSQTDDYDVFLCHNSRDKDAGHRRSASSCKERGILPWLDELGHPRPGTRWQQRAGRSGSRRSARRPSSSAPGRARPWQELEMETLLSTQFGQAPAADHPGDPRRSPQGNPRLPGVPHALARPSTCASPTPTRSTSWSGASPASVGSRRRRHPTRQPAVSLPILNRRTLPTLVRGRLSMKCHSRGRACGDSCWAAHAARSSAVGGSAWSRATT